MLKDIPNRIICRNEPDLKLAGERLLNAYPTSRFFMFYGEMGAGKTTFIKVICSLLGCIDVVNSPTFSIVNVYRTINFDQIYHFDLYRLKSIEEVYDIGYEDYFYSDSYCFVEWPEKIENLEPPNSIRINIEVDFTDGSRIITF